MAKILIYNPKKGTFEIYSKQQFKLKSKNPLEFNFETDELSENQINTFITTCKIEYNSLITGKNHFQQLKIFVLSI
jgi:hypothetical protein